MIARQFGFWAMTATLALGGCGNGGSAVETRDRAATSAEIAAAAVDGAALVGPNQKKAVAVLTANRRETVDAKTERLFARNGAAFGARTAGDYLAKVQAFTASPPGDVERVERPNGDLLLYHASTNTFAVVSRDGAAKTMFKPDDGANYWAEQKARAPTFGQRRNPSSGAGE